MDLRRGVGVRGGRDEGGRKSESEKKVVKMKGEKQVVRVEREGGKGEKGCEGVREEKVKGRGVRE